MNPPDQHAEAVWQRTLPQIRSTLRRRARRRIAGMVTAVCGMTMWLAFQSTKPSDKPVVHAELAPPVLGTIAVIRIDDHGTIRLEEVSAQELGMLELALGQTPLLSDDLQYW